MTLFDPELLIHIWRARREITRGALHLPGWLPMEGQARLSTAFREWTHGSSIGNMRCTSCSTRA